MKKLLFLTALLSTTLLANVNDELLNLDAQFKALNQKEVQIQNQKKAEIKQILLNIQKLKKLKSDAIKRAAELKEFEPASIYVHNTEKIRQDYIWFEGLVDKELAKQQALIATKDINEVNIIAAEIINEK